MYYVAKVAKEGRLCLPIELRRQLGWDVGTKIKITESAGKVYLERADRICKICGTTEKIIPTMPICEYCVSVIKDIDLLNIKK